MPVTNFPNGIFATPVLGASNHGLWTSKVWFVDSVTGRSGATGKDPTAAVTTIARAIALAGRDQTIYVRPLAVGTRYTENITVPVGTHAGLSIIGTSNSRGNSVYQGCSIRGVIAVDDPVLTLNSSFANIENLHFWSRAAQTVDGFGILMRWNTPVGLALNIGSSIVNCSFTADVDDAPAAAGDTQNAIRMDSTEGQLVQNCLFHNCRSGISIGSTQSASYAIKILGNQFSGIAANIAADIYATDVTGLEIHDNIFGHAVPTHAAGTLTKYIYIAGTTTGAMARNYQGASAVAKATNNASATGIIGAGNFGLGGPWTS